MPLSDLDEQGRDCRAGRIVRPSKLPTPTQRAVETGELVDE